MAKRICHFSRNDQLSKASCSKPKKEVFITQGLGCMIKKKNSQTHSSHMQEVGWRVKQQIKLILEITNLKTRERLRRKTKGLYFKSSKDTCIKLKALYKVLLKNCKGKKILNEIQKSSNKFWVVKDLTRILLIWNDIQKSSFKGMSNSWSLVNPF
jgi:hypothetical protein